MSRNYVLNDLEFDNIPLKIMLPIDNEECDEKELQKSREKNRELIEKMRNNKKYKEKEQQIESRLEQWPVQIKLVPENASYFSGDILVAADCTAYAYGDFHRDFMQGKAVIIGCTKLDAIDYSEKLAKIFHNNDIKSITVTRMEVPCCGGMEYAVTKAIQESGKQIPLHVITISRDGMIK